MNWLQYLARTLGLLFIFAFTTGKPAAAVASICGEDWGPKLLFSTLLFSFVYRSLPFPSPPLRNRAP